MSTRTRRKCRHCGQFFRPDPRNVRHQRYCSAPACRRASKAASQRRWLAKAANRDYFCGPEHVARVRAWRAAHPGYARKRSSQRRALQELSSTQPVDIHEQSDILSAPPLQDIFRAQALVLTGLIAHLTGAALQEDIALTSRRLQQLALDIAAGDPDGRETIAVPAPPAPTAPRGHERTSGRERREARREWVWKGRANPGRRRSFGAPRHRRSRPSPCRGTSPAASPSRWP